jgi:hypothetical protein
MESNYYRCYRYGNAWHSASISVLCCNSDIKYHVALQIKIDSINTLDGLAGTLEILYFIPCDLVKKQCCIFDASIGITCYLGLYFHYIFLHSEH